MVGVDKFTVVKMYDKVQHYWAEEKKQLVKERNEADTKEKRDELSARIDWMGLDGKGRNGRRRQRRGG